MVTREEFAALALALPDATAGSHFGQPDFRVRNKIFCGLDRSAERASLKMRKEMQALLLQARPQAFVAAAGAWGESGWTYVELTRVELDELRELVTDAWRLIAPARLAAQLAEGAAGTGELVITVDATAKPTRRKRSATRTRKAKTATRLKAAKPARKAKKSPQNGKRRAVPAGKTTKAAKNESKKK